MTLDDAIEFSGTHWATVDGDVVTVGLTDDAVAEIDRIVSIELPEDGDSIEANDVIGSVIIPEGSINLVAPLAGEVIEINSSLLDDPSPIEDDPTGEGWLFKIEASDGDEISQFLSGDTIEFEEEED